MDEREYVLEKIPISSLYINKNLTFEEFIKFLEDNNKDLVNITVCYMYPENRYYDEDNPYRQELHICGYRKRTECELEKYDKEQEILKKLREKERKAQELRKAKIEASELKQLEKLAKKYKKKIL